MLKDLFAAIYEAGIYDQKYTLIFSTLYDDSGYIKLGLLFILIPLVFWFLFYFVWHYPYGKLWHWTLWLFISAVITFACAYGVANTEIFASNNQDLTAALNDPQSGYAQYATNLPLTYALINAGLSLVLGFIYSLLLKQFSKIQMHLPF